MYSQSLGIYSQPLGIYSRPVFSPQILPKGRESTNVFSPNSPQRSRISTFGDLLLTFGNLFPNFGIYPRPSGIYSQPYGIYYNTLCTNVLGFIPDLGGLICDEKTIYLYYFCFIQDPTSDSEFIQDRTSALASFRIGRPILNQRPNSESDVRF